MEFLSRQSCRRIPPQRPVADPYFASPPPPNPPNVQVEERQLDENKVNKAMVALAEADKANREAQRKREKELAAVQINSEDVEVISNEFALDKKAAELRLREMKGDLEAALKSFLD